MQETMLPSRYTTSLTISLKPTGVVVVDENACMDNNLKQSIEKNEEKGKVGIAVVHSHVEVKKVRRLLKSLKSKTARY